MSPKLWFPGTHGLFLSGASVLLLGLTVGMVGGFGTRVAAAGLRIAVAKEGFSAGIALHPFRTAHICLMFALDLPQHPDSDQRNH